MKIQANNLWAKMQSLSGDKLFFVAYLFLFGVALLLCSSADIFTPAKVVATSYKAIRASDYPWIHRCLVAMALVHFVGGIAFFWKLCYEKLDL